MRDDPQTAADPAPNATAERILDVAETAIRRGGFDAASFRDIAEAVGIRSASVHYHFPTKADLGRAAMARYRARMVAALGAPDDPGESPRRRIARLAAAYRAAMGDGASICLGCALGAETAVLPAPVRAEVTGFYTVVLGWTARALGDPAPGRLAPESVIATLQGASVLAVALGDPARFDAARDDLLARLPG